MKNPALVSVSIVGVGYVGLVTAACLASLGYRVTCVDSNHDKIDLLNAGNVPFYEPGLPELIKKGVQRRRLFFVKDMHQAIGAGNVVFICVGTPPKPNGEADVEAVQKVASQIAGGIQRYTVIVEKSTVPVYTGDLIRSIIGGYVNDDLFDVASNPEFLREGRAIDDFLRPDRIVLGVESARAERLLRSLYAPVKAPMIVTTIKTAEIIKHVSNSFLAMKISFMNAVARVSDGLGTDIEMIASGIGLDKRIGKDFLRSGIGFGGSCFPKDLDAFYHIAQMAHYDFSLLREVKTINVTQREYFLNKVRGVLGGFQNKKIGVLGLSFKPQTDDIREAPALVIIDKLLAEGAKVKVYDPVAMDKVRHLLGKDVEYAVDPYDALRQAECACLVTEWDVFKKIQFSRAKRLMRKPCLIADGRNLFDPAEVKKHGLSYIGVGRS